MAIHSSSTQLVQDLACGKHTGAHSTLLACIQVQLLPLLENASFMVETNFSSEMERHGEWEAEEELFCCQAVPAELVALRSLGTSWGPAVDDVFLVQVSCQGASWTRT